jgi:SpoVK/Ycf46/Vps4 family AAA+-type ATPase
MSIAKKEQLPKDLQEIWDELIMPVDTNISFDQVILSDENREKYRQFIKEQEYRDKLYDYGLNPANRLLLYGSSGTGKTFSLKALSNLLGYTMVYVDIAKSLSDGSVSKNISNVFKLGNYIAENYDGCVIFFDEADSIAWNRDASNGEGGVARRATNSIFQALDQMSTHAVFAAATNMLHRLDPAFERRLNMKLMFKRPDMDMDECIKHFIFPKFIINDDVDDTTREIVKRRAKANAKLSYYEIEELVKRAMKNAILSDTNIVRTSEIYKDLATNMNFKIRVGTGDDNPEIFQNSSSYEPRY